ncbi:hypothetical protein [Nostoc sp. FACHB-190]|uniref:hypothetical protein n=1 Tax=Nostoc sp. FACHB-190 TaxID=2692838 RepID=UPI00168281C5|nr:hypothetical protein [Nostoc sp. FACHB-190]MBD2302273.1 hypothetical protein [Nostoc sp. FACHB-190]
MSQSNQNNMEDNIVPVNNEEIVQFNQASNNILLTASAGLALQGVLVSANEEEILQPRFNLIAVQGNISLTQPLHQSIDKTEEFQSQFQENIFKKGVEKFGTSIKASAEGSSLFQGLLNASASFSLDKEAENLTERKQKIESSYYSKVQYVVVPTAAFTLNPNQIRLDSNALEELKKIDKILRNPESEYIASQACQTFLKNYGSHALLGIVTFGSISLISASSRNFLSSEEQNIRDMITSKINTHFQLGFTGIGGGELETNHNRSADSQSIYKQESIESGIKLEKIQIGGLKLEQSAVIDRDYKRIIAIWEIICRHHINEFQNTQKLTEILHNEWISISGLRSKFRYFFDEVSNINNKIDNLLNQQIPLWIQQRNLSSEKLNYLVRFRKEIETKTNSNQYWTQEILSAQIFRQYLFDVRYNNSDSIEIKDLMRQILTSEDTLAMSREDYSQLKDIFRWLNEQSENIGYPFQEDINDVNELLNKISNLIRLILQENAPTREIRKKQASQYLALAINSLSLKLRKKDPLSELSLLSLLFTLGYIPDFKIFNQLLEIEDYQKIEKLLKEDKEHPLGIEAKNYNTEKREAYIVLRLLTSDILQLEKEKTIDFIEQSVLPNLQSESIINILKRYNVGLSFECIDAVGELQNIINYISNDRNVEKGWQDFIKINENLPLKTIISSDEKPSAEVQEILESLGLTKYYPGKLGREEVYSITEYSLEQNTPVTTEQLATHFLSNLISFNYEGRKLKIASANKSTNESEQTLLGVRFGRRKKQEQETSNVYPLDVVAATFLCCNAIIRQDLVQRLWGCKLAIPLVIQEDKSKAPKFFLWAIRSLIMKWKTLQGEEIKSEERGIFDYCIETVSFIRFNNSEFSKSSLLNWVISENEPDKSHPIFFHRNSEGSTNNRQLAEGMIEVAWYLPKGSKEDIFEDILSFTNLRGDARNYPVQLELIKQVSSKIVILSSAKELLEKEAKVVQDFIAAKKTVIILLTDKIITNEDELNIENFQNSFSNSIDEQLLILDIENKNSPDIRDEIRKVLNLIKIENNSKMSLGNLAQTMQQLGINVDIDELEENCQQGIRKAEEILHIIRNHEQDRRDKRKAELLPLQGKDWAEWAEADKEIHRQENIGEEKVNKYAEKQELRKIKSRERQFRLVKNGLPKVMNSFINVLLNEPPSVLEYFVRSLKLGLDELSREELPGLYDEYGKRMKEIQEAKTPEEKAVINRDLEKLDQRILAQSFGLEHLLREMGQIYSAVNECLAREKEKRELSESDIQILSTLLQRLPQVAANLLLSGYPIEIMDGDVSSVPFVWVEAVLEELNQILKEREKQDNLRVFVLSAMGIQSSGKSTLLNTMFGLQFAVSAGRCTKGVYLQPVKLEQKLREKLNVDYIFVVDTEGLKSPELSSGSTRKHDNELSTFVIGLSNLALIKLPGENNTYLQEMLPISVHAFLRMEEVNLHPKTKIVHRNVDKSSQEKLNTQSRILNENLDKYTRIACEFQGKKVQTFKELIDFNLTEDVEYLPSLYEGDDSRNAVIPNYSKEVNGLKRKILYGVDLSSKLSINSFYKHLQNLWEAVKKDDFVYEFKNTIETQARGELDKFWSQRDREFRSQVTEFILNSHTRIMNCGDEDELFKVVEDLKGNLSDKIDKIFLEQEESLKHFFKKSKGMYEDSMQQWEQNTFARLRDLSDKLKRQNNQQIENYHNSKQAELTVDREVLNYEKRITESIRLFVQIEKEKIDQRQVLSLSEEKLQELFESQWLIWMNDLRNHYRNPLKAANVERDAQEALRQSYSDRWSSISEKILKGQELRNYDFKDFSVKENHYQWDLLQAAKNSAIGLTKGSIPKDKEQEVLREIEKLKHHLFEDVKNILQEKEDNLQPYNESYIGEILRHIESRIDEKYEEIFKNISFRLTQNLEIDLVIAICGHAIKRLERLDQKCREKQNPIIKLEKNKDYYFQLFKVNFDKQNLASTIVSVLCEIIIQGISEKIEEGLASEIGNKMYSVTHVKIINNKKSLIASILISLAEKGDIYSYYTYIHDPERSIKDWLSTYFEEFNARDKGVKGVIEDKIKQLMEMAKHFIESTNQYIESRDENSLSITDWINKFSELTKEHLIIKNIDRIEILASNFDGDFDFQYLQDELIQELENNKSRLSNELGRFYNSVANEYTTLKNKVVDEIIASRIGCLQSCPFCGEICISGMDGHDGSHETHYHRPQGLTGYRPVSGEPKLVTENCQQLVYGDSKFANSDTNWEYKPYKDYRQVNNYYASWKIVGDATLESGSYWKWFMITYADELALLYEAKKPDFPTSWNSLTKEKVIDELRKLIEN